MTDADLADTDGVYELKAGYLKSLSVKGGSVRVDKLKIAQSVGKISVRSAVLNKTLFAGAFGFADAPKRMRVLAGIMDTLDAQAGIAGVFIAGYNR